MLQELKIFFDGYIDWLRYAVASGVFVWWGYCLFDLAITISRKIKNKSGKNDQGP